MADDIFTLDTDNNAAVRTVSVKAGTAETNSPIIFTKDADGNMAVRVMGGAGSIDEDRIIIKSAEIPAASEDELGKFYCYSGVTNQNFGHGYIYECVANEPVYTDSVEFEPATLSGTVVTATTGALAGLCARYIQGDITAITNGTLTYDDMSSLWRFVGKDAEDNTVGNFQIYQADYEDAGFTFTGTPEEGDVVAFTCTITEVGTPYSWVRIDVQPVAKIGRFLSGWNCATGLATTNPPESPYVYTTGDYFIVSAVATGGANNYKPDGSQYVIGQASSTVESSTVAINDVYLYDGTNWTLLKTGTLYTAGTGINIINGTINVEHPVTVEGDTIFVEGTKASGDNGYNSVVVGVRSRAKSNSVVIGYSAGTSAVGLSSIIIGANAYAADSSVAIGNHAGAAYYGVAIGLGAMSSADYAIQLGKGPSYITQNTDANTFKVGNQNGNFEIMSADGTIPEARLADTTNAQQGDVLTIDSNGNAVWQAADALPDQTGQAGKVLTTDGTDASWETPTTITMRTWGANE